MRVQWRPHLLLVDAENGGAHVGDGVAVAGEEDAAGRVRAREAHLQRGRPGQVRVLVLPGLQVLVVRAAHERQVRALDALERLLRQPRLHARAAHVCEF